MNRGAGLLGLSCFCLPFCVLSVYAPSLMMVWLFWHLPLSFWLASRYRATSARYPICQVASRTAAIFFGCFFWGNLAARDVSFADHDGPADSWFVSPISCKSWCGLLERRNTGFSRGTDLGNIKLPVVLIKKRDLGNTSRLTPPVTDGGEWTPAGCAIRGQLEVRIYTYYCIDVQCTISMRFIFWIFSGRTCTLRPLPFACVSLC